MNYNITTRLPNRGDIFARKKSTESGHVYTHRDNVYFLQENFNQSLLPKDSSAHDIYEVLGVVAWRFHDSVMVVYKKNVSKAYCARPWWYLSGYTLDGTARSGIISIRVATDSWAANVDKTINYNASDVTSFVNQLNTYFSTDDDMKSSVQDWYADVTDDGRVRVHCKGTDYRQYSGNTAKTGFSLTSCMPEVEILANILRKNGGTGSYGACANFDRMSTYFRTDSDSYTSKSDITTIKTNAGYPQCLPSYLGTSQYTGGVDHCKVLRAYYGEGEEGWKNYLRSTRPVRETDFGTHGIHNGRERTIEYASKKYTSSAVTTESAMMAAADYCFNLPTIENLTTVNIGEFWLPTTQELDYIIQDVKYGTSSSRTADILNAGLYKITGSSAISNGSRWWSCVRRSSSYAWSVNGNFGYFGTYLYFGSQVVPVSIFTLKN